MPQLQQNGMDENVGVRLTCNKQLNKMIWTTLACEC